MASKQREKELARQRAERQAARRAAAAARQRQRRAVAASVAAVVVVVAAVAFLATRTGGSATPLAAASPSASASPTGCSYKQAGTAARKVKLPPTTGIERNAPFTATMTTNQGTIVFDLLTAQAPCTVNSFRSLAHFAYFDGTPCHRLTTSGIYVLQCGDPTGTGRGGPGYQYDSETHGVTSYPRGTVAMANGGPGTNGSQFFLVYKDTTLPADYTIFGKVTKGLDVLDKIAAGGATAPDANNNTAPKIKVTIQQLRTAGA